MAPMLKEELLTLLSQNAPAQLHLELEIKTAMVMMNIHDDLQSLPVCYLTWFLLLQCSRIKFVGSLSTYLGSSYFAPAFGNKPETLNTNSGTQNNVNWYGFYTPLSS